MMNRHKDTDDTKKDIGKVPGRPTDFTLPELGEQIESGLSASSSRRRYHHEGSVVLESKTDKATIEFPSSVPAAVKEIKSRKRQGQVGQAILSVEDQARRTGRGGAEPAKAGATARRRDGQKGQAAQSTTRRSR